MKSADSVAASPSRATAEPGKHFREALCHVVVSGKRARILNTFTYSSKSHLLIYCLKITDDWRKFKSDNRTHSKYTFKQWRGFSNVARAGKTLFPFFDGPGYTAY